MRFGLGWRRIPSSNEARGCRVDQTVLLWIAAFGLCHPSLATAAPNSPPPPRDKPEKLAEEIVVTARHRAEKVQKVPIAITAIGSARLKANNINSVAQLQILVPTLQIIEANPRNTSFNIRGIGSNVSIANDGLESGVGVYIDGVFYGRPGQVGFDFPDLDNIQVLRGPQGTLFGKNTTAGAVDVHTLAPSFTPSAELETTLGNYNFWQVKGTVTEPLSDKVAARISFIGDQRDGTISSSVADHHYGTLDDKGVRAQVLAKVTDDLTLRAIVDYEHQLENCCVGLPVGVFTTLENGTKLPNNFFQRLAFLGYSTPEFNPFSRDAPYGRRTDFEMETGGASLQADYDLNGYTLTSISAARLWNWWPYNGDVSASQPVVFTDAAQIDWQRQISQELRVTSPTAGPVDYTGGFFFFYQDLPGYLRTDYAQDAGPYILGPRLPRALSTLALAGYNVQADTDAVTNSYAGYGQATWHVLPHFDLTGGLRYTYEDKTGSYDQSVFGGGSIAGLPPPTRAALQTIRNGLGVPLYYKDATKNSAVSYLLTASYRWTDAILGYATYARGNKSEGINVTLLPPGVDAVVKPERVDSYEIGVKSSWLGGRLVGNADAFWVEDTDYQGVAVAPLPGGVYAFYLSSVPKVRSRGFEFDTHAQPTDWLTLNFGGAFTDAIYESYPDAQCPPEISGAATKICNLTGQPVPGTSRWTTTLGGEVRRPVGNWRRYDLETYFGADFSLRSSFYTAANDSIYSRVPGYGLLDARLGLRTTDGRYDLFLWSHNATNTRYYQTIGAASPVSGLISGNVGDPITFGVTLRVRL